MPMRGLTHHHFNLEAFFWKNQRILKRGSRALRKTGYETMKYMKSAKQTEDNAIYECIIKKELEGKLKKSAKIAVLNKVLKIYYAG